MRDDLYVIGSPTSEPSTGNYIRVYDGQNGSYIEDFVPFGTGLYRSRWMTIAPDGDVLTSTAPGEIAFGS